MKELQAILPEIEYLKEFNKHEEGKLAKIINQILASNEKTWGSRLTKIHFSYSITPSYDLEGITDEILKQRILINAQNREDLKQSLDYLSKYEIATNIFYIPDIKISNKFRPIESNSPERKGWNKKDLFLTFYIDEEEKRPHGYTTFDSPREDFPIKKSLSKIRRLNKIISFLLNNYYCWNILPYLDLQTEVYNKNYLNKLLARIEETEESKKYLLINIDVNRLKKINDEFGHLQGDKTIKYVAKKLTRNLRSNEIIVRWGGDEFLVIVPDADVDNAAGLIRRINSSFEKEPDEDVHFYGISLGYALKEIKTVEDFTKVYNIADKMMYENKKKPK